MTLQTDRLRLVSDEMPRLDKQRCARLPPRHAPGQLFLKGPIPMDWLASAAALPGKALHVGLALWFQVGLKKTARLDFSVTGAARLLGFSQPSASRGLRALEKAGLVQVERNPGRRPVVAILDCNGDGR